MFKRIPRLRRPAALWLAGLLLAGLGVALSVRAQDVDPRVLADQERRVAVIDKVKPAVVAVFAAGGQGGGSGVLISKDGYALTNFHVVEGSGPLMQCGLADGVLYDAVLVGLDKVGDVSLIKLHPKTEGKEFPFAVMGDSDKVRTGDWSLAMGNPFLLATDFNPTVTFGLVSGVHRYQYPSGTLLEYTDCIQVDTSINPGNSGGPLFNMDGELIGINGRGSFEKRGRVNSGVGYAISINQIKNFLGHLRAGLDTDHATLGAAVESDTDKEEGSGDRIVVRDVIENSDVHRRGLEVDDELVSFAGRPMTSVNEYKNVLGLFPKGWRMPLVYRHNNEKHEVLVRLMQLQRQQEAEEDMKPKPKPGPPLPQPPVRPSALSGHYDPKPGFANYYFNKLERDRLLKDLRRHGDFGAVVGDWVIEATLDVKQRKSDGKIIIRDELQDKDAEGKPVAREGTYHLKPETLPDMPEAGAQDNQLPLRQAVRKVSDLLKKHARSFPQEYWAQATDEELKKQVLETQKNVATIQTQLQDALDELKKAGQERAKESSLEWQAQYDYALASLSSFMAYVNEYNLLLGQLRKEPPPRDPKIHRGWRMASNETIQSPEAKALASEAQKAWDKMIKDYKGTAWAQRARAEKRLPLGLAWQPTGGTKTVIHLQTTGLDYELDPLVYGQDVEKLKDPPGSGGLLMALYQYRRLLTLGPTGFEVVQHGGHEPLYPPGRDDMQPKSLADLRVDTEVLLTEHAAVPIKWYFSVQDDKSRGLLLGFEAKIEDTSDPCEVYLSDYRVVDGRELPHRIEVRSGDRQYGVFTVKSYQLAGAR